MNKKIIIAVLVVVLCLVLALGSYLFIMEYNERHPENKGENNPNTSTPSLAELNTTDNTQVIKTNSNSTIRIINNYDKSMFEGKNTILFMWASWCPNCATEMNALNEILKKYKNDNDFDIVFIAHEFKDRGLDGLFELLEGGTVDFDTEILVDFKRIIRKNIDPNAGTIPKTYFLDKNTNVLHKIDEAVTVKEVDDLINKYYK